MDKEKIVEKFKKLISEWDIILKKAGWDGNDYYRWPSALDYSKFRTESLNLIKRVCGEKSNHYSELIRIAESKETSNDPLIHNIFICVTEY